MMDRFKKPYKIFGFYDSETNNIADLKFENKAYPILHQLATIKCDDVSDIDVSNVEDSLDLRLFRHTFELIAEFDSIIDVEFDFVPVICIHNLAFDMYPLSDWLSSKDVKVLAKSRVKPITFTIQDENGNPKLVLWDTLSFSMKSLAKMGDECGYPKLDGAWDYDLQRTPITPLSDDEIEYAKHDIYVLACWLSWWMRRNPEIDESKLGLNVVTKTGVVREKRHVLFSHVKGNNLKHSCGKYWHIHNNSQKPKTDDELHTMHACTRGGFTFCSSVNASVPFETSKSDSVVIGVDATSQHPAQMLSKFYPCAFEKVDSKMLDLAARIVQTTTLRMVLDRLEKPFNVAFNAQFRFENLRLKKSSVFEKCGIACLASARFAKTLLISDEERENNEASSYFREKIIERGYKDTAIDPDFSFGKLNSAKTATLFLTEIEFWNVCQVYDFDSVVAIGGYLSTSFCRPTDYSLLSVVHFYTAKQVFKKAMESYSNGDRISNFDELAKYVPEYVIDGMRRKTISIDDVKAVYAELKESLNSLFGIEATNECRVDMILTGQGIAYDGGITIENLPKSPKAWYQFGQRIVGWSRTAQVIHMMLASKHVKTIINGDTDSLKMLVDKDSLNGLLQEFDRYNRALNHAISIVSARIVDNYDISMKPLQGIGEYVVEFESDFFCASWNKAYCIFSNGKFDFTLAGVPSSGNTGINAIADYLHREKRFSFSQVCNVLLGYNVIYDSSVTRLNARNAPEWCDMFFGKIRDHNGTVSSVSEPCAMAIFPMQKMLGATSQSDNEVNSKIAKSNNPDLNITPILVKWDGKPIIIDILSGDEVDLNG